MTVFYNSSNIIPAPFCSYSKNILIAGDQRRLGNTYQLTMRGEIVSYKGSPQAGSLVGIGWGNYQNLFWVSSGYPGDESIAYNNRVSAIEKKQEALRVLFSTDGAWLSWESVDGAVSFKCQIKNAQLTFDEGIWWNTCPYTITAETDIVYVNGSADDSNVDINNFIQNCSETWDVQEGDIVKTFKISHQVSATAKRMFDSEGNQVGDGWQHAQNFVETQLVLGYNGWSNFSYNPGSTIFQNSALNSGVINLNTLSPYNFARSESVDEMGGSYAVTETWTLAASSGAEVYNVSVRKISDQPYTTVTASINGTIKGFYTNLFDYDQRLAAASWQWSQISGVPLFNRVNSYVFNTANASGATLNYQPLQAAIDEDYNAGTLSYNYEFSNTLYEGDAFESYTVNRKTSVDSYKSQFGIQGTIRGRRYDGDVDSTIYLKRAQTWWNTVTPTVLYNRIINSKYFPAASSLGLQPAPLVFEVNTNEAEGIISYSYEFDNRKNDSDISDNSVIDEYTITQSFNRNDGISSYNIAGTVKGLNIADSADPRAAAFANASGYYYSNVLPNAYNRISTFFNINLSDTQPYTKETIFNIPQATVGYQFGFYNYPATLISGVLSEVIEISQENWEGDVQVIANIPIPSRQSGPILQNIMTTTAKMRRLSIEAIVGPTGSTNILSSFNLRPNYDQYVVQLAPAGGYIEGDTENWSFKQGRYTRNISWIFE